MTQIGIYILIGLIVLLAAGGLYLGIRQIQVKREIARQRNSALLDAPALSATSTLEILPLYEEASANGELISGHGVSYLLRTDTDTILLDVGNNPEGTQPSPLIQNMDFLRITLDGIDAIVISHAHPDHLGGVEPWREGVISVDPSIRSNYGISAYSPVELNDQDLVVSSDPVLVSREVATTGAILYPEVFPLNLTDPIGLEQALIVSIKDHGLVLITGCGHPGLEELINRAEDLYKQPLIAVVGGLHYGDSKASDLGAPIDYLRAKQPELVALSPHDSETAALNAFKEAFPASFQILEVGRTIRFP